MLLFYFIEFIEGVSQFSVKGDKEQKLRCKYFFSLLTNQLLYRADMEEFWGVA